MPLSRCPTVLVVDDEEMVIRNISRFLTAKGCEVRTATSGVAAMRSLESDVADIILLDIQLPDINGIELIPRLRSRAPGTAVVICSSYGEVERVVAAMRQGARDYIQKPVNLDLLFSLLMRIQEDLMREEQLHILDSKQQADSRSGGKDDLLLDESVRTQLDQLPPNMESAILILGETGTGKSMLARLIHDRGQRKSRPFMDLNCAALSETLLESEMFGHEKGAFTDARQTKRGLLEVASGGSLFLDEIGSLSPSGQAKLLKVIEEKVFRRVGGTRNISVDMQVICAGSDELPRQVESGAFRRDLFYRLNAFPILIPPLRKQGSLAINLAGRFLRESAARYGKPVRAFSPEALEAIQHYSWPGNIRELHNVTERAAIVCKSELVGREHLAIGTVGPQASTTASFVEGEPAALAEVERHHIMKVLDHFGGNRTQAAHALEIDRVTLTRKLKGYQEGN